MFESKLRALIDFDQKIVITVNHGRLDDPVSFNIEFEPAISRDHYCEGLPDDLRRIWEAHNTGPAPDAIISSSGRKTLLTVFPEQKGGYLIYADHNLRKRWARNTQDFGLPVEYLDEVLCAIPSHPYWKEYGHGRPVEVSLSTV